MINDPYRIHRFGNGIRLVHRQINGPVAHFGVIVNAGSRDETPDEQGLAHFIEHMIFKGTLKRNSFQVINSLENVGADMNAFTTKEETCVYASFLSQHTSRTVEVLSDILFNSTFPDEEMKKERSVIIDEINSYKDNPSEWIHDEFDEILFPGHPLGMNILGTPAKLKKYTRTDLVSFIGRTYATDRMVLSFVGNVPFSKILKLTEKYFGSMAERSFSSSRQSPGQYLRSHTTRKFGRHQAHLILGNRAYDYLHPHRIQMALLNNMLGGPSMNSILNLALREKHGIAYNLESNYQPLSDTGLFSIYLGTDEKMIEKAIELVEKELKLLRTKQLGTNRMKIAREQLKGQLAISMESMQNEMITAGKSLLVYNKIDTLEEIIRKLDAVQPVQLMEVANKVFDPDSMSLLVFNHQ
ncbi:MAG: insulinase family protein [Bacteroidales bacterium]|nr:insulinase family protein [Bacteroidales bacterium]